ncbi:MAG: hypothetical protein ACR2OE_11455 [Thermomicrobiales bacterium]
MTNEPTSQLGETQSIRVPRRAVIMSAVKGGALLSAACIVRPRIAFAGAASTPIPAAPVPRSPLPPVATTPGKISQLGIFMTPGKNHGLSNTIDDKITEAKALTADSIRLEQVLARPLSPDFSRCAEAGLSVVLTIRDNPQPGDKGKPTVFPPHTPSDLATFRTNLESLLAGFTPSLIAVENEESGSPFVSGTVSDYLAELEAAIAVGHDHGIRVTNGGITSSVSAVLTWQDLYHSGSPADADDFAKRILAGTPRSAFRNALEGAKNCVHPPGPLADAANRGQDFLKAYATMPLDYVNFHWYLDDDKALRQTVEYLRRATGHQLISNELGQTSQEPSVVTGHITTLAQLEVPVVIWFDTDGIPAIGLHDAPGQLRPNGQAFVAAAKEVR